LTHAQAPVSEADQLSFFADADRPAGLEYWPEFITPDDERVLIDMIQNLPLQPFQFGPYEGKRKVVSFGFHYDYSERRLKGAEPIPAWLQRQATKIERFRGLDRGAIGHVLCTEYETGVGIGWHRDKPHFDQVFGLSLGSACRFRFRRKSGEQWIRFTLDAKPRSLYLLTSDARHLWEHSIPDVEQPRYSITFRTMRGPS
jgi:alkylated DNA repair dioxygenase AlkB